MGFGRWVVYSWLAGIWFSWVGGMVLSIRVVFGAGFGWLVVRWRWVIFVGFILLGGV